MGYTPPRMDSFSGVDEVGSLILAVPFLVGFSSMIGQILLMRELMVVFYGNELSLGVVLGAWLLWGGAGSWALGRTADRIRRKAVWVSVVLALAPLTLVGSILLARTIKPIFGLAPGEVMGITPMIASAFLVLLPCCATLGYLFVLATRAVAELRGDGSRAIAISYLLEGLGASVGGLLGGLLLIKLFNPLRIAALVGAIDLISALALQIPSKNPILIPLLSALSLGALIVLPSDLPRKAHIELAEMGWRGMRMLENRNSYYGNIAVLSYGGQISLFENGLWMLTTGDPLSAEESVHYPLLEHPNPKSVLLIGGGLNGSGNEALKHGIERMVYLEIDPMIVGIARKYLGEEMEFLSDPRVKLLHLDARLYIKRAKERFDAVVVNLPDPFTAMLNRYYSLEFFKEVKGILNPGGIVSVTLTSSENYLSPEQRGILSSIYRTMREVFPDVIVLPGEVNFIIGKLPDGPPLTLDPRILGRRIEERKLRTLFVTGQTVRFRLMPDRVEQVRKAVEGSEGVRLNRDLHPIGYLYDMLLWSSRFRRRSEGAVPGWLLRLRGWHFIAGAALLLGAGLLLALKLSDPRRAGVALSIATTGFSEISFQVVVLLAFQVFYGYVYYKLSLILTSFMIGLVLGSWAASRARFEDDMRAYRLVQLSIALYPLALMGVIRFLERFGARIPTYLDVETAFSLLPIVAGFIGGFQFPLASRLRLKLMPRVGRVVGLLYGADLMGSCVGALLTSVILLPLLGIYQTCLFMAVVNGLVLLWLIAPTPKTPP